MKTLEELKEYYQTLDEQSVDAKLTSLVRSGLFDSNKLTLLKRALNKDNQKLTPVERNALLDLLDRLITYVTTDHSIYTKLKQDVMTESWNSDAKNVDLDVTRLPPILILKRRAIRVFPDGQKVALYWADRINKYVSVPFQSVGISEAVKISQDDIDKNPRLARAIDLANTQANNNDNNPPETQPLAQNTPPKEVEQPVVKPLPSSLKKKDDKDKKLGFKRISPKAQRVSDNADEIRRTLRGDYKTDVENLQQSLGFFASRAGALGMHLRRKRFQDLLASRRASIKESFSSKITLPVLFEADDNPYQWNRERPEKGIKTHIQGVSPSRVGDQPDPYEDPDSSLHQQQQNIMRRANRAIANQSSPGRTVYEEIKSISEGTKPGNITIQEQEIMVTPAMAKNIVRLYENVNRVNKAKMENSLKESTESFFKLLDFAVKKT